MSSRTLCWHIFLRSTVQNSSLSVDRRVVHPIPGRLDRLGTVRNLQPRGGQRLIVGEKSPSLTMSAVSSSFGGAQNTKLDQPHELRDLGAHFFGGDGSLTGARQIAGAKASHQS